MHEPLTDELWQEREEAVAEVQDPDFLANAAAAQMELDGEVDVTREELPPTVHEERATTPGGDDWMNGGSALAIEVNNALDHIDVPVNQTP